MQQWKEREREREKKKIAKRKKNYARTKQILNRIKPNETAHNKKNK